MWGIELKRKSEISLSRQIFLSFKDRILSGELLQDTILPSTRELAKGLGVSRNTVCEAYDMLLAEGFIVSHQGAPTRVTRGLHLPKRETDVNKDVRLIQKESMPQLKWNFRTGQPDLSVFPWQLWNQMLHEVAISLPSRYLGYNGPKGYEPLCEEIAQWLMRSRSMDVSPEDIFITAGATQALYLLVELLHQEEKAFVLENPSHPGIRTIIADKRFPLRYVPVDEHGANISLLDGRDVSAVYVTPSHQFPLGGILPANRRTQLIRLAVENDFYILEDDYDSEFRYSGSPISPIYALDSSRVIYIGTFSKTLFPAIRTGFAVLPKTLQKGWAHIRNFMDVQNPVLEQAALAEFLHRRKMDKHVQRMRRIYSEKRMALLDAAEAAFGGDVRFWGDASGLHVAFQFMGMAFGERFKNDCMEAGLSVGLLNQNCVSKQEHTDKLLLGYGHLSLAELEAGIHTLQRILAKGNYRDL